MYKFFFTLYVCLFLSNFLMAQPESIDEGDSRLKGLTEELDTILENFKVAGFAVAVVEKDKVLYSKGFGYRDYENKIPATANTLFAIGSCTKAFTSSLLGQLRADEKVDFTERPDKYISELRFYNDELNNQIRVKDLMCHRTGIPRHDLSWYLFPTTSSKELIERIQYQEPFAAVRETWYYNNFMFLLQGEIAARLYRKSWADAVKSEITAPLGMERTNFNIDEMLVDKEASLGYGTSDGKIQKLDYYRIRAMAPAGSINSSVNEMTRWVRTWINGGKFEDKEILPADYVKEAMSTQMVLGNGLPSAKHPDVHLANYGYGWFMASYKGHYRVEHGGNIDGFSASTCFFPTDSVGIVVLVNQNGSPVTGLVRNIIADRMLEVKKDDWHNEIKAQIDQAAEAAKTASEVEEDEKGLASAHALEDFEGTFEHPGYGALKVALNKDTLYLEGFETKLWLKHKNYDVFVPQAISVEDQQNQGLLNQFLINFQSDVNGKVTAFEVPFEPALPHPLVFKRKVVAKPMTKEELEKYVGEYALAPTVTAKFYIEDENVLYAFIPGQPEYELVPTGKHSFSLKVLDGYSAEFVDEKDGKFQAVNFVQPNGTFKATRKEE